MGRIVAIGGGELSQGETFLIDQEIVKLSGQIKPKTLFVPTASYEPAGYCERFRNVYENQLGAEVDVLYLLDDKLSTEEIEAKIMWADIIYVGGGDTTHMLKTWRKKHVDRFLKEAYHQGTLLCGLSAGSICWFSYGQSEIENESSQDGFDYISLEALDLIHAFHCPHFNEGRRAEEFHSMIQASKLVGIALDNNCAIAIVNGSYRILSSESGRKAYKIYAQEQEIVREVIEETKYFRSLGELGIDIL